MPHNENGQPEGRPSPNCVVYHDAADSKPAPIILQVSRLCRLYAVNAAMAETIAPLVFLDEVAT
jgi:hypothetical protein